MSKEKLGIVFCTSQSGATRETFDCSILLRKVLDPVYDLLSTMSGVWKVLCVTPAATSFPLSEVPWNEEISVSEASSRICTPTSQAISQYSSTWPSEVRERLSACNTSQETPEACINDGVVSLHKAGATRVIVVPYEEQFPSRDDIVRLLITHSSPEQMTFA
ncbi:hypothetical protein IPH92_03985 [Candidatus Kaiserbacteria bacterium]|nr:MAG: hypothetical protein IPH92_03985 [Candidatus Kaiserbacteria bacterium]